MKEPHPSDVQERWLIKVAFEKSGVRGSVTVADLRNFPWYSVKDDQRVIATRIRRNNAA